MSLDVLVVAKANAIPSAEQWAAAISDEGFSVVFPSDFDTRASSGFLPSNVAGQGFEYSFGGLLREDIDSFDIAPQHAENIRASDSLVGLHYKDEPSFELIKAASAVLAKLTGGIVIEAESGASMNAKEALAWARGELEPVPLCSSHRAIHKPGISGVTWVKIALVISIACVWIFRWLSE
ncbi:hypothetical protein [Sedimenticola selenatireducens]|uniref:hypothetical protein n=1 Tax=Sedimenticola selenatireducens TaxID=191960 RepID=UPI00048D4127|nr:hypothetical protein [Sedimenticola selenatireducens]